MSERLVSIIGARAREYVLLKNPSEIIPFKGKLPILELRLRDEYFEAIENTQWLEDLSVEFQEITMKGNRIALFEKGFKKFLENYGIGVAEFLELSNDKKSSHLLSWMDKDCLDLSILNIK